MLFIFTWSFHQSRERAFLPCSVGQTLVCWPLSLWAAHPHRASRWYLVLEVSVSESSGTVPHGQGHILMSSGGRFCWWQLCITLAAAVFSFPRFYVALGLLLPLGGPLEQADLSWSGNVAALWPPCGPPRNSSWNVNSAVLGVEKAVRRQGKPLHFWVFSSQSVKQTFPREERFKVQACLEVWSLNIIF